MKEILFAFGETALFCAGLFVLFVIEYKLDLITDTGYLAAGY